MTAGRVILDMPNPALDRNGDPYANAKLYFYESGTTTLADVFSDNGLGTPLTNPVISDGAGRFVEIWADDGTTLDVTWKDADDATIYQFSNIIAFTSGGLAKTDASNIDVAAYSTALDLGTAANADTGTSLHTVPFLDGINTWTGEQNFNDGAQINNIDIGYLGLPHNTQHGDYTFALTDRGNMVIGNRNGAATFTIPLTADVAWVSGDAIVIRSIGTGAITIARDTGVTLRIAGSSTSADATLASFGLATLICDGTDTWCISGTGLS